MMRYIISEGQPTDYGGRTVKVRRRGWDSAHNEHWRAEDDLRLLMARNIRQEFTTIAAALGRTPRACSRRYQALVSRERRV